MSQTFTFSVDLTTINCGECGGTYAINERYREQQQQKGGVWTCPYCKTGWGYSGNSENEKLKRELAQEKARADQAAASARDARLEAEAAERKAAAARGQVTKIKRRVGNGICPCCKRTFRDLARHMHTQHPEYASDNTGPTTEGGG